MTSHEKHKLTAVNSISGKIEANVDRLVRYKLFLFVILPTRLEIACRIWIPTRLNPDNCARGYGCILCCELGCVIHFFRPKMSTTRPNGKRRRVLSCWIIRSWRANHSGQVISIVTYESGLAFGLSNRSAVESFQPRHTKQESTGFVPAWRVCTVERISETLIEKFVQVSLQRSFAQTWF